MVVALAAPGVGQGGVNLTGAVVDDEGAPIAAVLIVLDGTPIRTETDAGGVFRLAAVPRGAVRLSLRRAGYAPRTFGFAVPDDAVGDVALGTIPLSPGPLPDAIVRGRVSDAESGAPLLGVGIAVNGTIVGFSERDGSFALTGITVQWGPNEVGVRRIGYQPLATIVDVIDPETEYDLEINLHPLPIELPEVVVDADRAVYAFGRMREFYRRRRLGRGVFIEQSEILAMGAREASDILRGVVGVTVTPNARGDNMVKFTGGAFGTCDPRIWVDGFPLSLDLAFDNLNRYIEPEGIAGVEVYRRASEVPAEFSGGPGQGTCGALVIWTR